MIKLLKICGGKSCHNWTKTREIKPLCIEVVESHDLLDHGFLTNDNEGRFVLIHLKQEQSEGLVAVSLLIRSIKD